MRGDQFVTVTNDASKAGRVPLLELDDEALTRTSFEKLLSLSLDEMRAVQKYFRSIRREI